MKIATPPAKLGLSASTSSLLSLSQRTDNFTAKADFISLLKAPQLQRKRLLARILMSYRAAIRMANMSAAVMFKCFCS
jgi:hypothetical protein